MADNDEFKLLFNEALKSIEKTLHDVYQPMIIFNDNYSEEIRKQKRDDLMTYIENIMIKIRESEMQGENPVIEIRDRTKWDNCSFKEVLFLKPNASVRFVDSSKAGSRMAFAYLVFMLSKVYRLLQTNGKCTRRELYYQNIETIKSQRIIDSTIRDICIILNTPPWELGIMATSKGLVAGNLSIRLLDGSIIDCRETNNGVSIPQDIRDIVDILSDAKFILIVEKDAMFQKLLDDNIFNSLGPLVLITGKGYPDVNTRFLLKRLWLHLRIPIFAFVDADPYGIEIMCVYRFGSLLMSHEGMSLAVPTVRWLGLMPKDINSFLLPKLPLSSKDTAKLADILTRPYVTDDMRVQINILLSMKCKTEIEALTSIANYYISNTYLPHKIRAKDII